MKYQPIPDIITQLRRKLSTSNNLQLKSQHKKYSKKPFAMSLTLHFFSRFPQIFTFEQVGVFHRSLMVQS